MAPGGSMAPSVALLLNTPLILLPILLIPNDSPRLDGFLNRVIDHNQYTGNPISSVDL